MEVWCSYASIRLTFICWAGLWRLSGHHEDGVGSGMETWDAITSRRNVRSFTDRPIPAEDLDRILEAGRRSPSSQNWQPWSFILVTDREQLRKLATVWRGAGHVAGSAATIVVLGPSADNP